MKGEKLYHIISNLDKSERRQILHYCSKSDDKRHSVLHSIFHKNIRNVNEFQKSLEKICNEFYSGKTTIEKDKSLRRFISFATNELEDLKIKNYVSKNEKIKNHLLTEVFHKENQTKLFDHYVKKTLLYAGKEKDYYTQIVCNDYYIRHKSKSQKVKDLQTIKSWSVSNNKLINNLYHKKLSESLNLLSGLYLDNTSIMNELGKDMPDDATFDSLVTISKGMTYAVEYKVAQARLNYNNAEKFHKTIEEAEELLNICKEPKNLKDLVYRRLNNLKMVVGFHLGEDLNYLSGCCSEVMKINKKYKIPDSVGFWYRLYFLVLDSKAEQAKVEMDKDGKYYFDDENLFFSEFINAFIFYFKGEKSNAIHYIKDLAYCPNYYISLWSKLLEFRIYYENGDFEYCESLVQRNSRFILKNKNKPFTYEASKLIFELYKKLLDADPGFNIKTFKIPQDINLSPFHKYLFDWLKSLP